MTLKEAESCTILRGVVGSTVHGLALEDTDDRDEMGICIEPLKEAMGIGSPFEQVVYRTATERTGQHDAKSEVGDLDLTIYSIRKWMRLALSGNPTILTLLFSPHDSLTVVEARGTQLRELAPHIISRKAGKAFLGYMQAQRQRLMGERGQKRINRPDLIEKYGFDTKYAGHVLRLGFQGIELMETGKFTLPMVGDDREYVLSVRKGLIDLQDVTTRTGELEARLKDLLDSSPLPEVPNVEEVEKWMTTNYLNKWRYSLSYGE